VVAAVNVGPAKSDAVVTSSVTSRLGGTRPIPVMISTTKRKLPVGETAKSVSSAATAAGGASSMMKLGTTKASSVKSRLGDPITYDGIGQQRVMITTKRKLPVGETAKSVTIAATAAGGAASSSVVKFGTTKASSVKSRLGDPVTDNGGGGQQRVMIATKRKRVEETVSAADAATQSQWGKSNVQLSIRSRLGEQVTSSLMQSQQARIMIPTTTRLAGAADDDEELGYVAAAKYKTVFGRLGPSPI